MAADTPLITGRTAVITTLVSLALSPFAIVTGYYVSKRLAAPKLSIEYIRADAEREPYKVSKTALAPVQSDILMLDQLQDNMDFRCESWLDGDEVKPDCFDHGIRALEQLIAAMESQSKTITDNVQAIEAWKSSGDELVLVPIVGPDGSAPNLAAMARRNRPEALEVLRGYLKGINLKLPALKTLLSEVQALKSRKSMPRTGVVQFYVGVLNSGDGDAVIYPNATLKFGDSAVALVRRGGAARNQSEQFTVIKGHSFAEIPLVIDDAKSEGAALSRWKALVTNQAQEKFTIELKTDSQLSGDGRLPE